MGKLLGALVGLVVVVGAGWYIWTSGAVPQLYTKNSTGQTDVATNVPQRPLTKKPNIIFVLTDDLDVTSMSQFPKLKALMADKGMTFENHFVSLSLCCPSRAATLCGEYAHNTGVFTNSATNDDGTDGAYTAFLKNNDTSRTMAVWLKDAGYQTALMGKYLNGYDASQGVPYTVPEGWTDWAVPLDGNAYGQYNYTLNVNGKSEDHYLANCDKATAGSDRKGRKADHCKIDLTTATMADKEANYMMNVIEHKAEDFITTNAAAQKPFFVYIAPYTPHSPSTPAPKYESLMTDQSWLAAHPFPKPASFNEADTTDKPKWAQQAALLGQKQIVILEINYHKRLISMYGVEDMVSNLIDTLAKAGELDNTYIVFTSDNGFHLGEHRLESGKLTEFDTDLRVPLIVRGPGIKAGSAITALTANVDIAPTMVSLAGLPMPASIDGRSLTPLLFGQTAVNRNALLIEHADPASTKLLGPTGEPRDTETQDEKIKGGELVGKYIGVRTPQYTFVHYVRTGEDELYDDLKDPQQLTNIAATADASLVTKLRTWATDLSTCKGETCRTIEAEKR
jgi:arylsulfatase A-like enzyme